MFHFIFVDRKYFRFPPEKKIQKPQNQAQALCNRPNSGEPEITNYIP